MFFVGNGDLDMIAGKLAIDSGTTANDRIDVNDGGNTKLVDYQVTPTSVTSSAQKGQPARTFAGISYDATIESFELDGSNAANTFDVTPSLTTQIFINGNLPAPGTVPPRLGDFLRVNFSGITGQFLTLSPTTAGAGVWQFGSGQQSVSFASIERFNGVESDAVFSAAGTNSTSAVKVFDPVTGLLKFTIPAASLYGNSYRGGVTAVTGDINGDGIPDIIVVPDSGANPTVKVFDGTDGHLLWQFNPFADKSKYTGGLVVAVGDVNGDGWNDIVVGPASVASAGIPVRVFDGNPNGAHAQIGKDFYPFGSSNNPPVTLAVADQNVNGGANLGQIVVASTLNGVATFRSFVLSGSQFVQVPGSQFQPFGKTWATVPEVTTGDVNGDGVADIIASEEVGTNVIVATFDTTGHTLTPAFMAFTGVPKNDSTFLEAHDENGDGKTDFVSAFYGNGGITGNVTEFSLASHSPIGQYTANVGNFTDLSGVWNNGGQLMTIVQTGLNLVITSPTNVSTAYLLSGLNLLLVNGKSNVTVATVDPEALRWTNGTAWEKIDVAGLYNVNGALARIEQQGSQLWIINAAGKFSVGQITSTSTLSAANFGLTASISKLGEIDWSDGSTWTKVELASQYLVNGKLAQVIQDGNTTVLVNAAGKTSVVRFIDPTHFVAVDWNNMAGQIKAGGLLLANGDRWLKDDTLLGIKGTSPVSIQENGSALTFTISGKKYSAQLVGANRVNVATLGMATIANGQIVFDSGVVWTGFDPDLLYAMIRDYGLPSI